MKQILIKILKTFFSDARQAVISAFFLLFVGGAAGLIVFSKKALSFVLQIAEIPTPLWVSILLVLICCVYTYLKVSRYQNSYKPPEINEVLYEECGINWNSEYKKRCLYCKSPLKYSSPKYGPSVLFCSACNRKHVLKDINGNPITEQQAIEKLKDANQRMNLTP